VAGRPLSPATRLRLGAPLPPLLADRTRAPPLPDLSFYLSAYGVLAAVSSCCPPALDSFSRVTHPSATMYSISKLIKHTVRLACVRHAASVRPEPGSNSPFDSLCSFLVVFSLRTVFYCQGTYRRFNIFLFSRRQELIYYALF
jgi:hypothetical protein